MSRRLKAVSDFNQKFKTIIIDDTILYNLNFQTIASKTAIKIEHFQS